MVAILHQERALQRARLARVVERCLRKAAAERFQTMAEVIGRWKKPAAKAANRRHPSPCCPSPT